VPGSTLEFYRTALALRREHGLGAGDIEWLEFDDPDVLGFRSGAVTVVANTGAGTAPLPEGTIALRSGEVGDGVLPGDTTVWIVETGD
jgi:alpha-glucosidase